MRFESIINTIYKESYPDHFPMHWHKYVEIISIPEDASENESGMVRLNQKLYELHSGDILFIWPGELHEVVDNQEHTLIALQFPYTVLSEIKDFATRDFLQQILNEEDAHMDAIEGLQSQIEQMSAPIFLTTQVKD